jgi:hypothetical protein
MAWHRAPTLHAGGSRFSPQQPKIIKSGARVVLHAFNPSHRKAEADGSLELRPVWSPQQVLHQPEILMRCCLKKSSNNDNDSDDGNKVI